jgi:hypothetical protein
LRGANENEVSLFGGVNWWHKGQSNAPYVRAIACRLWPQIVGDFACGLSLMFERDRQVLPIPLSKTYGACLNDLRVIGAQNHMRNLKLVKGESLPNHQMVIGRAKRLMVPFRPFIAVTLPGAVVLDAEWLAHAAPDMRSVPMLVRELDANCVVSASPLDTWPADVLALLGNVPVIYSRSY